MMRILCALLLLGATQTAPADAPGLSRLLEGELGRIRAKTSLYVKHLPSGAEFAVRGDEPVNSMSVIKLAIMVRIFEMRDRGELTFDERETIRSADKRDGSGVLQFFDVGIMPTLHDLIVQMIITSDNTATDRLVARIGGVAAFNEWLDERGYPKLRLNETTGDLFRTYVAQIDPAAASLDSAQVTYALSGYVPDITPSNIARRVRERREMDLHVDEQVTRVMANEERFWFGRLTAREIGRLLEAIQLDRAGTKASCDDMKFIMSVQQLGAARSPHYLDFVGVSHKTGDFPPALAHDVGIIATKSGPVVFALLVRDIQGAFGEAEDGMARIARLVAEYFDGRVN